MDGMHLTFTSLALIVLVVILLIMFVCHFLGARNNTRNNSKEKIGLSASKLFHANGYVLHSGSEFLLSTSGSFKRFDCLDKEDFKTQQQQQQQLQQQQQQQLSLGNSNQQTAQQSTTTPLWNLPQQNIPPQPLRPAPQAPPDSAGFNKTVTFSFRNELPQNAANNNNSNGNSTTTMDTHKQQQQQQTNGTSANGKTLISCMKNGSIKMKAKTAQVPQLIDPPPPARLAASTSSSALSGTAIPRPLGLRQTMSLQNPETLTTTAATRTTPIEEHHGEELEETETGRRRLSNSTNPFLCESTSTEQAAVTTTPTTTKATTIESIEQERLLMNGLNGLHKNPFIGDVTHEPFIPQSSNHTTNGHMNGSVAGDGGSKVESSIAGVEKTPIEAQAQSNLFRNRSLSETEDELKALSSKFITAGSLLKMHATTHATNPFNELKQKMKGPHLLQKTISEDFLFRKIHNTHMNGGGGGGGAGIGGIGFGGTPEHAQHNGGLGFRHAAHNFLRQNSTISLGGASQRTNSQCSLDSAMSCGSMDSINLTHGISCDSVDSDSSTAFVNSLDQTYTQITGYLRVGLHYDKNANKREGMALTVSVLEAKGLICPLNVPSLDTFVRIYLVPDQAAAMQTEVFYNSETPVYNESFECWLKKHQGRHSLWFHLYHCSDIHTLIGEAEMEISEIPRPIITWIPLSDSRKCNAKWGELMFSLSYLPTAERLTIVIVKARNLKREICTTTNPQPQKVHSVFVKVYLMNNEKKVLKKRTTMKRSDRATIFNEAMIFSVPPHGLTTVQLRLTVFGLLESDGSSDGTQSSIANGSGGNNFVTLGHVIAGSCSTGKGLRHWHQMLSSLRKPVAMWHVLRAAANQPIFTGGAEAVVEALQQCNTLRSKRNSVY